MDISHFNAALIFSTFASIIFGITQRNTTREMVNHGLYCFAIFMGGLIAAGWIMWLLRH